MEVPERRGTNKGMQEDALQNHLQACWSKQRGNTAPRQGLRATIPSRLRLWTTLCDPEGLQVSMKIQVSPAVPTCSWAARCSCTPTVGC